MVDKASASHAVVITPDRRAVVEESHVFAFWPGVAALETAGRVVWAWYSNGTRRECAAVAQSVAADIQMKLDAGMNINPRGPIQTGISLRHRDEHGALAA